MRKFAKLKRGIVPNNIMAFYYGYIIYCLLPSSGGCYMRKRVVTFQHHNCAGGARSLIIPINLCVNRIVVKNPLSIPTHFQPLSATFGHFRSLSATFSHFQPPSGCTFRGTFGGTFGGWGVLSGGTFGRYFRRYFWGYF